MNKELKELIKKIIEEELDKIFMELNIYIIVISNNRALHSKNQLNEGKWMPAGYKDYYYRKDVAQFDWQQLHVHIAHAKHVNSKNKQVAWNLDTSRHDRMTFDQKFTSMEKAKEIAREVLGLPKDIKLESKYSTGELITEEVKDLGLDGDVYVFNLVGEEILKG